MARLRRAYPYHPVLLARGLFIVMTVVGVLAAIGVYVVSAISMDITREIVQFQSKVNMPLPLVFGILAFCMAVAWMMSTQAAISIGRECPLAPWEKKERERLSAELSRLTRQRQMMERVKGTPMGARPRLLTPVPSARTRTGSGSTTRGTLPTSMPPTPSYGTPAPGRPGSTPLQAGSSGSRTATPAPVTRGNTPLGAAPRGGTPVGWARRTQGTPTPAPLLGEVLSNVESPTDHYNDPAFGSDVEPGSLVEEITGQTPSYVTGNTGGIEDSGFGRSITTHLPRWDEIDEPWLLDAVEKASILAESFPIQARLEFNQGAGLPFSLVLERATPAMAVRAMMAFVEFLASIATPPKGRVELRAVAHLDRSFHRNVKAALDPYFPGTAEVIKQGDYVDIIFHEPDRRWNQYPYLPVAE